MNLQQRIKLLAKLGNYLLENNDEWQSVKQYAYHKNSWFTLAFIDLACNNIVHYFLRENLLGDWAKKYNVPDEQKCLQTIGIVMAGNIPLVGFHDFLSVFISGHKQLIKLSSKDDVLLPFLINKLISWDADTKSMISISDILKNCDAYIATGSNNSGRYFEYYFGKYPSVIRKNRTSVAVLDGTESTTTLDLLADDMMLYFGLGCRNVTKLFVPDDYDFVPLLTALKRYNYLLDEHKYRHNFDYQLALQIMNNKLYMNSDALIVTENESLFSPISVVNYSFYKDENDLLFLENNESIQCIAGNKYLPFGATQQPSLNDYADGVDTMQFLMNLSQKMG
ncbi:acyl-CoA reductase [Arachidicoccus ginsenosidimutans]|uniref:acyl-CoA reductase n=1 Tax=Arachidicoccus sp. BS20 TaxID=1850526 RepID=UPI0007F17B10|nr:acyl-CoA reductase [Arachidicoccus sp. BS20]ANI88243.1 acyl-CoA reductase [Arachidicoccus sp. BS20]